MHAALSCDWSCFLLFELSFYGYELTEETQQFTEFLLPLICYLQSVEIITVNVLSTRDKSS